MHFVEQSLLVITIVWIVGNVSQAKCSWPPPSLSRMLVPKESC